MAKESHGVRTISKKKKTGNCLGRKYRTNYERPGNRGKRLEKQRAMAVEMREAVETVGTSQ